MNAELSAIVLTLDPAAAGAIPASQARAAHALWMRLVADADPALADQLHQDAQAKPFTCSDLWPAGGSRPGSRTRSRSADGRRVDLIEVRPGQPWHLRYTTLSAELTGLWRERILPHLPETFTFGDLPFRLQAAAVRAEEHPWAGRISYADLASPYLLGQAPAPVRWAFSFVSPTAFHSGGMTVPVPLPGLLFGSLLDRWNAWSPVALNPEVRRFAQECVAVSSYRLRTRAVPGKEGAVQRGAVGRCDYTALNKDRYWCSTLSLLAAFAFYSGAGYQTTQGMGMVKWLAGEE